MKPLVVGGCVAMLSLAALVAEPPPMIKRAIAPSTNELRGVQVSLEDHGVRFVLFLPHHWTNAVSSNTTVNVHFHTVPWFIIQEHVRRAAKEPLIIFTLGEGSSTYRTPFEDTNRFARILSRVETELKSRGATGEARISAVDISSFSAGYGAVRELVKTPDYFQLLRRVVLLDSLYAGLEPEAKGSTNRRPLAAQIDVWIPWARAAMQGEKTFVITHSQVPTSDYASSSECANALLARLGLESTRVETNSSPASRERDFPLLSHADRGRLHVWSYGGDDAQAHMTHARHLADVWMAVEAERVAPRP